MYLSINDTLEGSTDHPEGPLQPYSVLSIINTRLALFSALLSALSWSGLRWIWSLSKTMDIKL